MLLLMYTEGKCKVLCLHVPALVFEILNLLLALLTLFHLLLELFHCSVLGLACPDDISQSQSVRSTHHAKHDKELHFPMALWVGDKAVVPKPKTRLVLIVTLEGEAYTRTPI